MFSNAELQYQVFLVSDTVFNSPETDEDQASIG